MNGPNVSPGYYHLDEENRAAFVDGWFHTGDLGAMDEEGYLRITGRKKNLFKTSGGKYVSPEKLENLFQSHPYVHQIVVLGDGRKFVGALVVPVFASLEAHAREQGLAFAHSRRAGGASGNSRLHAATRGRSHPRRCRRTKEFAKLSCCPRELSIEEGEVSATTESRTAGGGGKISDPHRGDVLQARTTGTEREKLGPKID